MTAEESFDELADRFVGHYGTLRGVVRQVMLERQLALHLPAAPARIVDIGGGAGHQAIPLARRGYHVTIVDPSAAMLDRASTVIEMENEDVIGRMTLIQGTGESAPAIVESGAWDAVICHAVLPYVADPERLLDAIATLARPGAVVSLVAKNAESLAMRPALERRFGDVVGAFDRDADVGGLGVPTRAHRVDDLTRLLWVRSIRRVAWYGIRVFTDHLGEERPGPDVEAVLAAEFEAGRRDPYRKIARLIHLIGQKAA